MGTNGSVDGGVLVVAAGDGDVENHVMWCGEVWRDV